MEFGTLLIADGSLPQLRSTALKNKFLKKKQ